MEVDFGGAFLALGVLLVFVIVGVPLLIHYSSRKTTQHAPHTPLWRRVLSLPQTRLGWWAIGVAAPALVLVFFSILGVSVPWVEAVSSDLVAITILVSAPAGGLLGLIALARDQSLLVWVAQVPALIVFSFLFGFGYEGGAWVPVTTVTVLWAALAFGVIWSYRDIPGVRGRIAMSDHHTIPQREADHGAVDEAQSRREAQKQARFIKVIVGLGLLLALISLPVMLYMLAELVDPLRQLLNGIF